jgi:hypothetical protein
MSAKVKGNATFCCPQRAHFLSRNRGAFLMDIRRVNEHHQQETNNGRFYFISYPSFGHKLQITNDVDRFPCAVCGNEHIVDRSGGNITFC